MGLFHAIVPITAAAALLVPPLRAQCEVECRRAAIMVILCVDSPMALPPGAPNPNPADIKACEDCLKTRCGKDAPATTGGEAEAATLLSPAPGAVLGSTATFQWTKGARIKRYQVLVGWTRGGAEIAASNWLTGQQWTVNIPPKKDGMVFVTLHSNTDDGRDLLDSRQYRTDERATAYRQQSPQPQKSLEELLFGAKPRTPVQAADLSGSWIGSDGGPMLLSQDGTAVIGSFRGVNARAAFVGTIRANFDGTVVSGVYQMRDGNRLTSGQVWFRLTPGGSLDGNWSAQDGTKGVWILNRSATVPVQGPNLTGRWVAPDGAAFNIDHRGSRVVVDYKGSAVRPNLTGRILGVFDGFVVLGNFESTEGNATSSGFIRFIVSKDGRRIDGDWTDANGYSSSWVLTR